jgi:hypothetical protein
LPHQDTFLLAGGKYNVIERSNKIYVSDRIYLFDPDTERWFELPQRLEKQLIAQQVMLVEMTRFPAC